MKYLFIVMLLFVSHAQANPVCQDVYKVAELFQELRQEGSDKYLVLKETRTYLEGHTYLTLFTDILYAAWEVPVQKTLHDKVEAIDNFASIHYTVCLEAFEEA